MAIRFHFHNSSICVVNSHLAAHIEEYERRNQDFKDICTRIAFRQSDPSTPPHTILKHEYETINILLFQISIVLICLRYSICICTSFHFCASHFSVVFWIGDLNYRISELDVKDVKELISKKDFETLHNYDQVISQMVSSFSPLKSSFICYFCSRVQMLTSRMRFPAQEADR